MELRLGQLLLDRNILTQDQVQQVLEHQQQQGKPFGLLCEEMFGIAPKVIEEAWARQYAMLTRTIDPEFEVFDDRARELITRRQAWQFRILPIRFEDRELMIATTATHLPRALRFVTANLGVPSYFVLTDPFKLGEALCRHFPLPGMTPQCIDDSALDYLVSGSRDRESA